jgi:3-deoxy-D-manno-octulosonic-acid transferase
MMCLYRLLFLPALLLALPYYLLRMWRRGGYRKDFQHRLGRFHRLPSPSAKVRRFWLQAVSVGEVLAIGPLIDALQAHGDVEIVLTTTTSTGYAEARKRYSETVLAIGLFPLDFWLFSRWAWQRIQPDAVLLTESELWPEHLHQAQCHKVPAFLINARLSDRSYRRYQKLRPLAQGLIHKLEHVFTASEPDQARFLELGAESARTTCTGNIKFDVPLPALLTEPERQRLHEALGFPEGDAILLGSSTWPGEEACLIRTQQALLQSGIACSLLLVPRHAERGDEIAQLLKQQPLSWQQRSKGSTSAHSVRIHLADTTGELTQLSQLADLAFIGKSLPPNNGGQTPIEAAGLGIPLLMGPHMNNFKSVASSLLAAGAACSVTDADDLQRECQRLLSDAKVRTDMQHAAQAWYQSNQGSSQQIADCIRAKREPRTQV